jgi:hypothetical protein
MGLSIFIIEKLQRPNNVSGKVDRWSLRKYLQQIEMLVKKVGGELIKVNPTYISIDGLGLSLAKGIDRHTASAYLIALRGIERYKTIQKAIT